MEGEDIDLYADVDEELNDSSRDIYDDAITQPAKEVAGKQTEAAAVPTPAPASQRQLVQRPRGFSLYVGNLTWWTTDRDLEEAVASMGVQDLLEARFHENRINGQSKGFCVVTLGSESSQKVLMEKMPKHPVHGQSPVVTYATKVALAQFEAQSNTREAPPPPAGPLQSGTSSGHQRMMPSRMSDPIQARGLPITRPPPIVAPHSAMPFVRPPPLVGGPPPLLHHAPPGMPSSLHPHQPILTHVPPPIIGSMPRPVPPIHGNPAGVPVHVNPAFFAQGPPPGFSTGGTGHLQAAISEVEFEEIMRRNKTVSSTAIARAVEDAANFEYASAIETLVTAISLIKQSKVAHDDRCKIIVSALQDTLRGIESKSYNSRRDRSRSRERSYRVSQRSFSREREYHKRSREYSDRGRDREREYYEERQRTSRGERDRERDYYDERQRYKERLGSDRDRETDRVRSRNPELEIRGTGGGVSVGSGGSGLEREKERDRSRN